MYLFTFLQGMSNHPPRDLTSLLVEVRIPDDIEKCFWAKKFREHLGSLGRSDLEAMLDFVIVCNVLRNKESEVKQCRSMKWRIAELNKERRDLLKLIGDSFFSEQSVTPIPLTNQVLREELCDALAKIDDDCDEKMLTHAFDLAWQARCDYKVWKGGLDSSYNRFIALNPSPPLTAVLLTIM